MDKTITALMLVKNEDRFVWFAIKSVIEYVDKMIIFDDGSTDSTARVISSVIEEKKEYAAKIHFEIRGKGNSGKIGELRQNMLEMVDTDYILMVDGDEIWWKESIEELLQIVNTREPVLVAQHYINCAKDIYHYRHPGRDAYPFLDERAAGTIRLYSMSIPGLHYKGRFGTEGLFDSSEKDVHAGQYEIIWQHGKYLHMSKLRRSGSQAAEWKDKTRKKRVFYAYDYQFPEDYKYPEVLYLKPPEFVKPPFEKEGFSIRTVTYFVLDGLKFRKLINKFRKDRFVMPEKRKGGNRT